MMPRYLIKEIQTSEEQVTENWFAVHEGEELLTLMQTTRKPGWGVHLSSLTYEVYDLQATFLLSYHIPLR